MKKYKLVENDASIAIYSLMCDREIMLKAGTYEEVLKALYQIMQPGDTYQEFHESRFEMPLLDYDAVMKQKRLAEEFDQRV